jgi:hypothetical protein
MENEKNAERPQSAKSSPSRLREGGGFCITLDLETIDRLLAPRAWRELFRCDPEIGEG